MVVCCTIILSHLILNPVRKWLFRFTWKFAIDKSHFRNITRLDTNPFLCEDDRANRLILTAPDPPALLTVSTGIKNLSWPYIDIQPPFIRSTIAPAFLALLNPLTAKLFNLNFHPLEVVSRWRDPQRQVSGNYSDLTKWRSTVFKYCWLIHILSWTCLKGGT